MLKKCFDGFYVLILVCGIVGVILLVLPSLFQITPKIVLSGSMEPEIPAGSVAYITDRIGPEKIREMDVIAYRMGETVSVLHRVIDVDEESQSFQTKGDANQNADLGRVTFTKYEGKELFSIPYLGYILSFIQSHRNVIWILICMMTLGTVVWSSLGQERRWAVWIKK